MLDSEVSLMVKSGFDTRRTGGHRRRQERTPCFWLAYRFCQAFVAMKYTVKPCADEVLVLHIRHSSAFLIHILGLNRCEKPIRTPAWHGRSC